MARPLSRRWQIWAISALWLAGCQAMSASKGPPQDPLFLSKVPANSKPELAPPVMYAYHEPAMPKDLFERHNGPILADQSEGKVPATLTNRAKEPE